MAKFIFSKNFYLFLTLFNFFFKLILSDMNLVSKALIFFVNLFSFSIISNFEHNFILLSSVTKY